MRSNFKTQNSLSKEYLPCPAWSHVNTCHLLWSAIYWNDKFGFKNDVIIFEVISFTCFSVIAQPKKDNALKFCALFLAYRAIKDSVLLENSKFRYTAFAFEVKFWIFQLPSKQLEIRDLLFIRRSVSYVLALFALHFNSKLYIQGAFEHLAFYPKWWNMTSLKWYFLIMLWIVFFLIW